MYARADLAQREAPRPGRGGSGSVRSGGLQHACGRRELAFRRPQARRLGTRATCKLWEAAPRLQIERSGRTVRERTVTVPPSAYSDVSSLDGSGKIRSVIVVSPRPANTST